MRLFLITASKKQGACTSSNNVIYCIGILFYTSAEIKYCIYDQNTIKNMKITSYMAIFQVIYIVLVHCNNLLIFLITASKKQGASGSSNNDIYCIGIIVTIISKILAIKILHRSTTVKPIL